MIKLVIFDLWNTLAYRSSRPNDIDEMLQRTGVKIERKKFTKIFEQSLQTKKWASKAEAYENLCKNIGLEVTAENVKLLTDLRNATEERTQLFPHTIAMLTQLREQKYKIGLLSNSSKFAIEKVRRKNNLLDYIDYPLFSFDVGVIKPDLKIFTRMLEITGYQPAETIMIGDNPDDDIFPPRELGMNSLLYTDYETLKKDLEAFNIKLI
jgi:putative hydrolase of the HAD superfamily